jgi:hypothetical protein
MGWDVTALVQAQYAGSNFGFRISDQTENAGSAQLQQFGSRETGSTPPAMIARIGS